MSEYTFNTKKIVTLVGGAAVWPKDMLACIEHSDSVFAADGGADHLLKADLMPDGVIGDFDSMSEATKALISAERLHHITEQNTTDFEKCISRISAPLILGVGFMGGRIDHTLTVFSVLLGFAERRCLLVNEEEIVFLAPPSLQIDLPRGTRFSIFPMAAVTGRSQGLLWPIDDLCLAPGGRTGVSNQTDGLVTLEIDEPVALIILPRFALDAAIRSLLNCSGQWPAHEK